MSYIWMRHAWVMSHIWMSHVTHMSESCHTYEWVTSHIWMSHVTHMNESCHTYEWVMSHIWISNINDMNKLCQTYKWGMHESCHTCDYVMSHIWALHLVGETSRLSTRPRDRYQTAKSRGTKVQQISSAKISKGFAEACHSRKAMQADDGEEASAEFTDSAFGIWEREVRNLPDLDTIGLAASLLTFPAGLACHGSSSRHMGEIEMRLLTGGRRPSLKVQPTECIGGRCRKVSDKYQWVMSHMNELWHAFEWVVDLSYHTYGWVISLIWLSHVTHMNESWLSHVTHMNEPCHIYERVMSYIRMCHVSHVNQSCMRHVTHMGIGERHR